MKRELAELVGELRLMVRDRVLSSGPDDASAAATVAVLCEGFSAIFAMCVAMMADCDVLIEGIERGRAETEARALAVRSLNRKLDDAFVELEGLAGSNVVHMKPRGTA